MRLGLAKLLTYDVKGLVQEVEVTLRVQANTPQGGRPQPEGKRRAAQFRRRAVSERLSFVL